MSGSFGSLSELVQNFESGGDYGAQSNSSTASGAYQFINSTWQQYFSQIAGGMGLSASQYPTAASAPAGVQDAVFAQAVSVNGLSDWTCPGCDPKLSAYLASNPSASSLPALPSQGIGANSGNASGVGTSGATGGAASGSGVDLGAAAVGGSSTAGQGQQASWNPLTWISALGSWLGALVGRGVLIVLAIMLIAGAILIYALRTIDEG